MGALACPLYNIRLNPIDPHVLHETGEEAALAGFWLRERKLHP